MELSQIHIRVNLERGSKVLLQKAHKHLPAIQTQYWWNIVFSEMGHMEHSNAVKGKYIPDDEVKILLLLGVP